MLKPALMTLSERDRLLANGRNPDRDHVPVVKVFDPCGAATWLFTELDAAGTLFGLCDLGQGFPELGYADLEELQSVRGRLGLPLERDAHFSTDKPISVWADAARAASRIIEPV